MNSKRTDGIQQSKKHRAAPPVILAAALALFLNFFVLVNANVPSASMEPAIASGGNVLASRLAFSRSSPQRGDIVVFRHRSVSRHKLIKRVIATQGETVELRGGTVTVNGEVLPEPYVIYRSIADMPAVTVPEGCCFVMGDNRPQSNDSSVWDEPFVSCDDIIAKTVYVYKGVGVMGVVTDIIGTPLGYLMKWCYDFIGNYGAAIIVFTLLTRIIMLPVSLMVQKNSIKMLRMRPKLDALRFLYADDKDRYLDEQIALYKKEKYRSSAGFLPLAIQLLIIFGLIGVMYNPLSHILHLPVEIIALFTDKAREIIGGDLGNQAQIRVIELLGTPEHASEFYALAQGSALDVTGAIAKIKSMDMSFLGLNLAARPSLSQPSILLLMPLLSGLSSLLLCLVQNRKNVLQSEQGKISQWGMTIFMIAFSVFFTFLVPAGMGIYWVCGNLFGILTIYAVNAIYNPKKFIDYKYLDTMKELTRREEQKIKLNKPREKQDYKRFFENTEKGMKLMFYSEQSGFYKYFQNIIEALMRDSNLTVHYVTGDPDDAVFKLNNPRIVPYYIGEKRLIPLMMRVEADMVVMTLPDLEKYHIKRSKVKKETEYVYVDHACASLNLTYRAGAFDYFDTVFAVSRGQAREIRAMEKLRGSKKKRIIEYGYGLIDNMIAAYKAMPQKAESEIKTILIAPSWQEDNILDSCLDEMLANLIGKGYKIVVRPHPQYVRRFPMNMEAILKKYSPMQDENFVIETDFSSNVTVYTADLVITDWSSIGFEFSFTTDRPALFVNTKMKVVNPDYDKIDIVPFTIEAREKVGKAIEKDEMGNILAIVTDLIENRDSYSEQIVKVKNEHFYNLGHSGEVGAKYIIERLGNQ